MTTFTPKYTLVQAWDCPKCRRPKIWAYEFNCPNCNAPRSRGVTFYLPPDAPIKTPEMAKLMGSGPNWYCDSCDSANISDDGKCRNCGHPRDEAKKHGTKQYFQKDGPRAPTTATEAKNWTPDAGTDGKHERDDTQWGIPVEETPVPVRHYQRASISSDASLPSRFSASSIMSESNRPKVFAGVGVAILVIIACLVAYFALFNTHQATAYVSGYSWENFSVEIQDYHTVSESGWTVANGGRVTNKEWKDTGRTNKVQTGTERVNHPYDCSYDEPTTYSCQVDDGNGGVTVGTCNGSNHVSKTCDNWVDEPTYRYDPIYDWYYTWDIERWVTIGNYPTRGDNHLIAYDPIQPNGPLQKRIEHPGQCYLHFTSEEPKLESFVREWPCNQWVYVEENQKFVMKVSALHLLISIELPE